MNARRSPAPSLRAFTLIELLTVIAIIGVLAAILIPVVGKVRQNARAAQCVANLRQSGTLMSLFADDNKGRLVFAMKDPARRGSQANEWWGVMYPYTGRAAWISGTRPRDPFACPSSKITRPSDYTRNGHFAYSPDTDPPVFLGRMAAPSRVILMFDVQVSETHENNSASHTGIADAGAWVIDNRIPKRHGNANFLFCDGHVKSLDPATLPRGEKTDNIGYPWHEPR